MKSAKKIKKVRKVKPTMPLPLPQPVEMVSYSIKMVIPTGAYANIQPEIIVKAGSIEQAHEFIAPHLNKLWKEYYMISERRPEPVKPPTVPPPPTPMPVAENVVTYTKTPNPSTVTVSNPTSSPVEQSPVSGVAFLKATQAIQSCLSPEALNLIMNQIEKSTKLEKQEKLDLMVLVARKSDELNKKV